MEDNIIEIEFVDNGEGNQSEVIEPVYFEPENIVDVIMQLNNYTSVSNKWQSIQRIDTKKKTQVKATKQKEKIDIIKVSF